VQKPLEMGSISHRYVLPHGGGRKGVTLLELLRFYAETYVDIVKNLHDWQVCRYIDESQHEDKDTVAPIAKVDKIYVEKLLSETQQACEKIGLQLCSKHAAELLQNLKWGNVEAREIEALHENISRELSCHFYVGISEDRKKSFCDSLAGWEDIIKCFPASSDDIEEMNKCWALCRYGAAVFHSLLVMEYGLVELGNLLQVTDPKLGWDASCRRLETIVKAGHNANQTGLDFGFLEQLNVCIQAVKLAWRNKINHAVGKPAIMGGGFAPYVTEEIISTTRGFMRRLAERLP
jgi:hypothetical protein